MSTTPIEALDARDVSIDFARRANLLAGEIELLADDPALPPRMRRCVEAAATRLIDAAGQLAAAGDHAGPVPLEH